MVAMEDFDEEEEGMMVDWLLRHQCGLYEGVMDICVETLLPVNSVQPVCRQIH